MKINKKIIEELVGYLKEFNLSEIEYSEDTIKKGQTIMIIEAMKTMNHVPSTQNGVVDKILIKDGEPVEFGQPLISVK